MSVDIERIKELIRERNDAYQTVDRVGVYYGEAAKAIEDKKRITALLANAAPALVARIEAAERERDALWVSMQVVWQVANAAIRAGEMGGNPHDLFLEQYKAIQQVWKAAVNVIGLDPNDTLKAVFPEFVEKQPSAE